MTIPLLNAIEESYPPITVIGSGAVAAVLDDPERSRTFLPLERSHRMRDILQSAKRLRALGFSKAVIVNQSFRAALTVRLAGIPLRVGHKMEGRQMLLSHSIPYDEAEFEAWSCLDLGVPLGVSQEHHLPVIRLRDSESAAGREALGGATIGIQPGARFPAKSLPTELVIETCRQLQTEGYRLALLGDQQEIDDAARVASALNLPVVNLVGATELRTSLGALNHLDVMVGADTGLMHMAAASGCRTVQVFGPTPASKWGHAYGANQVLQAAGGQMTNLTSRQLLDGIRAALTVP